MSLFVASLAFLIPAVVFGQTRRGTIAVIHRTPHRIIVAADSRAALVKNGTITSEDRECKLRALGRHMIFVAAGFTGYDSAGPNDAIPTWRGSEEAHRAFLEVERANPGRVSVAEVARHWGTSMKNRALSLHRYNPGALTAAAEQGLLTTAIFAEATADDLTVLLVQLRLGIGTDVIQIDGPKPLDAQTCAPWCALGKGSIFNEFVTSATPRAREEAEQFERKISSVPESSRDALRAIRFVELTIQLHPNKADVGGEVDAAELNRGGVVTWLRRKGNCPEK